ncbi:peptidoglycan-binding domain-containing protein [Streptomyces sp. FL07-04A]|nr:peptidoglycan-binding domain-containing protein [Streptomyces sp. FL07-04A]MDX3577897.1 peptidoglycan-binding domain-containing protein [Streptomyces sp. FL07-04A]
MIDPTGRQRRTGRRGLPCPECGALRAPDNTPSCACARRASDALRDTRTAEAAAAEDFDPLRIRPYVELDDGPTEPPRPAGVPAATDVTGATDVTMRVPAAPAVPADATMPLRRVDPLGPPPDATVALPTPPAPPGFEPAAADPRLFGTAYAGRPHRDDEEARPRPRRRRTLLVATAGAVVAVVTAAGFAAGLFTYEKPTRESAAPEDVRAAVPAPSVSASAAASPSASRSAPPSAARSQAPPPPAESESPSPSVTPESATPTASPSSEPSTAIPTAGAARSSGPDQSADAVQNGAARVASLRRGDQGAEVTELQLRLKAAFFYDGEADGSFSGEVEDALRNYQWSRGTTEDGLGVYGPVTRARLESETKEP